MRGMLVVVVVVAVAGVFIISIVTTRVWHGESRVITTSGKGFGGFLFCFGFL